MEIRDLLGSNNNDSDKPFLSGFPVPNAWNDTQDDKGALSAPHATGHPQFMFAPTPTRRLDPQPAAHPLYSPAPPPPPSAHLSSNPHIAAQQTQIFNTKSQIQNTQQQIDHLKQQLQLLSQGQMTPQPLQQTLSPQMPSQTLNQPLHAPPSYANPPQLGMSTMNNNNNNNNTMSHSSINHQKIQQLLSQQQQQLHYHEMAQLQQQQQGSQLHQQTLQQQQTFTQQLQQHPLQQKPINQPQLSGVPQPTSMLSQLNSSNLSSLLDGHVSASSLLASIQSQQQQQQQSPQPFNPSSAFPTSSPSPYAFPSGSMPAFPNMKSAPFVNLPPSLNPNASLPTARPAKPTLPSQQLHSSHPSLAAFFPNQMPGAESFLSAVNGEMSAHTAHQVIPPQPTKPKAKKPSVKKPKAHQGEGEGQTELMSEFSLSGDGSNGAHSDMAIDDEFHPKPFHDPAKPAAKPKAKVAGGTKRPAKGATKPAKAKRPKPEEQAVGGSVPESDDVHDGAESSEGDSEYEGEGAERRKVKKDKVPKPPKATRPRFVFPYDLKALTWDDDHQVNAENTYCYCGKDRKAVMISCDKCRQLFHTECIAALNGAQHMLGDWVYRFTCLGCRAEESFERFAKVWHDICEIALYNLIVYHKDQGKGDFFHIKVIQKFIDEHWEALYFGRPRTGGWAHSVKHALNHKLHGVAAFRASENMKAYWSLNSIDNPAIVKDTPEHKDIHLSMAGVGVKGRKGKNKGDDKKTALQQASIQYYIPGTDHKHVCLARKNSATHVRISDDLMTVINDKGYRMARASFGVSEGVWYFEATLTDMPGNSHTRLGWSTQRGDKEAPVGYDKYSYSYRDQGDIFHQSKSTLYGQAYKKGDIIGFQIKLPPNPNQKKSSSMTKQVMSEVTSESVVLEESEIVFYKNGEPQGVAFKGIYGGTYYPAASIYMGAEVTFNFGPDFKYPPPESLGCTPVCDLAKRYVDPTIASSYLHINPESGKPENGATAGRPAFESGESISRSQSEQSELTRDDNDENENDENEHENEEHESYLNGTGDRYSLRDHPNGVVNEDSNGAHGEDSNGPEAHGDDRSEGQSDHDDTRSEKDEVRDSGDKTQPEQQSQDQQMQDQQTQEQPQEPTQDQQMQDQQMQDSDEQHTREREQLERERELIQREREQLELARVQIERERELELQKQQREREERERGQREQEEQVKREQREREQAQQEREEKERREQEQQRQQEQELQKQQQEREEQEQREKAEREKRELQERAEQEQRDREERDRTQREQQEREERERAQREQEQREKAEQERVQQEQSKQPSPPQQPEPLSKSESEPQLNAPQAQPQQETPRPPSPPHEQPQQQQQQQQPPQQVEQKQEPPRQAFSINAMLNSDTDYEMTDTPSFPNQPTNNNP